jgi:hypothetical protein
MIRLAAWYMEAISAAKLSLNTNGVEKIFNSGLRPSAFAIDVLSGVDLMWFVKMSIAQFAQKDRPFWRNQIERILSVDRRSLFSKSLYQLPRACNRCAPFFFDGGSSTICPTFISKVLC